MGRSRSAVGVGGENDRHGRSMEMKSVVEWVSGCHDGGFWVYGLWFLDFLYLFIGFWGQLGPLYDFILFLFIVSVGLH